LTWFQAIYYLTKLAKVVSSAFTILLLTISSIPSLPILTWLTFPLLVSLVAIPPLIFVSHLSAFLAS